MAPPAIPLVGLHGQYGHIARPLHRPLRHRRARRTAKPCRAEIEPGRGRRLSQAGRQAHPVIAHRERAVEFSCCMCDPDPRTRNRHGPQHLLEAFHDCKVFGRVLEPSLPRDATNSRGLKASTFRSVNSGIPTPASLCPSGHHMGLLQDANRRVSWSATARLVGTSHRRSQEHLNDKRTLVIHSLDDGRSSQARSRAFVAASKSTIPDALGAKTPIATLHMQIVGLSGLGCQFTGAAAVSG